MTKTLFVVSALIAAAGFGSMPMRAQEVTKQDVEGGANVEAEEAAAKNVGIRYYHIPFNGSNPDPAVAEKFLNAITASGSDPAFIHCAGGNRAATMWLIKRLAVDHWDVDRATKEATELGMTSEKLKQFAIDFAQSHKR